MPHGPLLHRAASASSAAIGRWPPVNRGAGPAPFPRKPLPKAFIHRSLINRILSFIVHFPPSSHFLCAHPKVIHETHERFCGDPNMCGLPFLVFLARFCLSFTPRGVCVGGGGLRPGGSTSASPRPCRCRLVLPPMASRIPARDWIPLAQPLFFSIF